MGAQPPLAGGWVQKVVEFGWLEPMAESPALVLEQTVRQPERGGGLRKDVAISDHSAEDWPSGIKKI
ncbi:hypothetical protein IC582_012150 [Cucumis melo]